jgi:aspartyl-tRNA(Asn)/glutamyl-tRNA(Gln) amidotransferase subunit B
MTPELETVIGLEVHVQLRTRTKLFCGCPTGFGAPPNTQTCPVCIGMPGVLPVPNRTAFEYALRAALALGAEMAGFTKFDRKHYFYPDLPKGYQISQYDVPMSARGRLEIETGGGKRAIGITRVHLEEDAGKSFHRDDGTTLVDLNRAGIPLLEIVSEPELRSPEEAYAYLTELKATLEYLEISDCDMEKGSLRCDANLSLRPKGSAALGAKTEVKNLNSFKNVRDALAFEAARQAKVLRAGGAVDRETRLWNAEQGQSASMRGKEEVHDYRYFPEPDLPPLTVAAGRIEELRRALPEPPRARRERLQREHGLSAYDAGVLTTERARADYFEEVVKEGAPPKEAANWVTGDLLRLVAERSLAWHRSGAAWDPAVTTPPAAAIVELVRLVAAGTISHTAARNQVLPEMVLRGRPPGTIVTAEGLAQVSDVAALEKFLDEAIAANPKAAEDVRKGKDKAKGALVGHVMKATRGQANGRLLEELIRRKLTP